MDSKPSRVPEAASRPSTVIFWSLPPRSFQLVISPVKICVICSLVSSVTGLSLFTAIAIPSMAICFTSNWLGSSSSFRFLERSPTRAVPARTAFGASPEPLPLFVTVTPGYFSINFSPSAWQTLAMEVEPFKVKSPVKSATASLETGSKALSVEDAAPFWELS